MLLILIIQHLTDNAPMRGMGNRAAEYTSVAHDDRSLHSCIYTATPRLDDAAPCCALNHATVAGMPTA